MLALHQFPFSHFNEKARWALDYKGIAHTRVGYLPGPHIPQIKKLSGQTQTPVLQTEDQVIPGSANIISYLEEHYPNNPLYPDSADGKQIVAELCEYYDREVGPATRTLVFSAMIKELGYLTRMFGTGKSAVKKLFYRATLPLVKGVIAKGNGVNPENIERSKAVVRESLDRTSSLTAESGYLYGNTFTVADLTAAALFAPIAGVSHPDMARPQPVPERFSEIINTYREEPTINWVNEIYNKHR